MKNYDANGYVINAFVYTYDANGNRTSVDTPAGRVDYQYDSLNQLTQETLVDGTVIAYEYDAVGNRVSKTTTQGTTKQVVTYTYNAANELTNVDGTPYLYDANGDLIDNGTKKFVYNADNRLVEVQDQAGATLATFTYDEQGRRTSKTTTWGTAYYHYDQNNNVAYVTDSTGAITTDYTWDQQGRPITMTQNGNTYYFHLNGHGDVTAITDKNGAIVASYRYDAWGNVTKQSGTMAAENPYRYAGYRWDETVGMYYLMARYYDPTIGRFITRDWPLGWSILKKGSVMNLSRKVLKNLLHRINICM